MKWRVEMQPVIKVPAAGPLTQDVRFAIPTGAARNILFWINIFDNSSTSTVTWLIRGASGLNLREDTGANTFWKDTFVSTLTIASAGYGTVSGTLSNPPAYLRWAVGGIATGSVTFEILADMWDT